VFLGYSWLAPSRLLQTIPSRRRLMLFGGKGNLPDGSYSWIENDEGLEVLIPVPISTKSSDVSMELTSKKIKLVVGGNETLVGELRGKISVDGSYWSIETKTNERQDTRVVSLKLEKKEGTVFDPEEWMGIIMDKREANSSLFYDVEKQDQFDIKEYIDSMGGYNEELVDKTMYSGITDDLYEKLMSSGLVNDQVGPVHGREKNQTEGIPDAQVVSNEGVTEAAIGDSSGEQRFDVSSMTVVELKSALRARGLRVSGLKAALATRLLDSISDREKSGAGLGGIQKE